MGNQIRDLRIDMGLTQEKLCRLVNLDGLDASLLSKMENGLAEPTEEQVRELAMVFRCQPIVVTGEWHQIDINLGEPVVEKPEPPFEYESLWFSLGKGKKNAKSRKTLCNELDISDRMLRRMIANSHIYGELIGNVGDGYFRISNEAEFRHYYHQEMRRSITNFNKLRSMRNIAKERGYSLYDCI